MKENNSMKFYEIIEIEVISFSDDIVRTSNLKEDNVKGYEEWNGGLWED